jgi:hypothetical protein
MATDQGDTPDRERDGPGSGQIYAWIGGLVLVLLGVLFLLQNMGVVAVTGNWWAFAILIPAVVSAATAVAQYRRAGNRLTAPVRGSATGALVFTAVALIFLFDLDWGTWWPVFVIIAGISVLLNWAATSRGQRSG